MFLNFYGLRQQPFGVTPDPAYLYPSRTHSEALTSLTSGIGEGRGFFALVAEPGMGKTTLLYRMLEGLRGSARTAYLFQTQCDKREFLQYILSELGADTRGLGLVSLHNKLNEVLFAELLEGRRFVLVVDEAQNLDDSVLETIRLLSNFETTHTKLLQIVLAGQPELAVKLAHPRLLQLRQRIAVFAHLQRFSPEETRAYVDHRLQVSGSAANLSFTPEALAAVGEITRGVPRNINSLCFRALSIGCERGAKPVTKEIVREASVKLGMELFANVGSPISITRAETGAPAEAPASHRDARASALSASEQQPANTSARVPASVSESRPVAIPGAQPALADGTATHYQGTYQAFTYQAQDQRPGWIYPAMAIGILAVLAISIPTLLRIAGPGLARAASISKTIHATPSASQGSGYAPEFGPENYAASPNDTNSGQVLTVVALPQQTLRDIALQHAGRYDDEIVKQIRALNPQLNPDQIEAGQLIRIPLPAGTWQKSFDTSDPANTEAVKSPGTAKTSAASKSQPSATQPKP
jgi:general secretion pathway protein A